jgi:hypothetical protein
MWRDDAACRGLPNDLFFLEPNFGLAMQVCRRCTVSRECFAYAVKTKAYGIWGETTSFERGVVDLNISSGKRRPAKRTTSEGQTISLRVADQLLPHHE